MRKIFLVEDDQAIREVLEMVLSSGNYDVQSFSTFRAFTERDINVTPDLYMFDVMLPDGSGIDLCDEIKKDVDNNGIPIIIMSAFIALAIGFLPLPPPRPFPGKFFLLGITVIYLPLNKLSFKCLAFMAPSLVSNSINANLYD